MSLQKESEWENELREMIDGIAAYQHNVGDRAVLLVKKVLSTREKEIAEEVEKTYGKDGGPALVIIESHEGGVTQRPALNEVLQILKH